MYFDSRNVQIVDWKSEAAAAILFVRWSCTRRWLIDKLEIFHANQTSMCLDPHKNLWWGWSRLSPRYFLTGRSKAMLLLWIFFVICFCHTAVSVSCSLNDTCLERTDVLAFLYVMFLVFLSLSRKVSWVRCGTWLYGSWSLASFLLCLMKNYLNERAISWGVNWCYKWTFTDDQWMENKGVRFKS